MFNDNDKSGQLKDKADQTNDKPSAVINAKIGDSVTVSGDIKSKEDLLIDGTVEGIIECLEHTVTIGKSGNISADIRARIVHIHGTIKGNISAKEQAIVHSTGRVTGDIQSPRVALQDGCEFKGNVDMDGKNIRNFEASRIVPRSSKSKAANGPSLSTKPR